MDYFVQLKYSGILNGELKILEIFAIFRVDESMASYLFKNA
jgi:hypothetical protein